MATEGSCQSWWIFKLIIMAPILEINSEHMVTIYWKYSFFGLLLYAILCTLVVLWFILKSKKPRHDQLRNEMKNQDVNLYDVMLDINNSQELYKILCRKCHPDKFINAEYHDEIEELYKEISKNKRNYSKLLELKEIASMKFNINF